MSFGKNYNNNDKQITNSTYSGISFSNPESTLCKSKLSISYFNKLMKLSIALKTNNNNSSDTYASYDNDNAVSAYISSTKAKILLDLINMMKNDESIHNVCVEVKNGIVLVSDGTAEGVDSPCISISIADENGNVNTVTYHTKVNYHKGAYNYDASTSSFDEHYFNSIELDTFIMVLDEYFKASSYAIAATVMEASMYKRNAMNDRIYAIAQKVGAIESNGDGNNYSNRTSFLSNNNKNNNPNGIVPQEYESASFDDVARSMS